MAFWHRTPRQIALMFEAEGIKRRREHNESMSLAWHTAALTRTQKKMPKLATLMLKDRASNGPRQQTAEEQIAIARMFAARGGGKVSTRK